ncbi:MAG: response regulator transcription factor [Blastocatellales bacterium]
MKVLIVDDNEQMRQMIKGFLRGQVEEFYECSDGATALDAFTRFRPDWVLMDLSMEEVDGLTATRQIIAACPEAKIMIVTNFDDVHLRAAAQDAGASGYVTKDDLFELRRLLSRNPKEH